MRFFLWSWLGIVPLLGCSEKFQHIQHTVMHSVSPNQDAQLTPTQLTNTPFATLYVTVNEAPRITMILMEAEDPHWVQSPTDVPRLKWISEDKALLVTQNGRIVATRHWVNHNLQQRRSESPDPLSLGVEQLKNVPHWHHHIDVLPNHHYHQLQVSHFEILPVATVSVFHTPQRLIPVKELVRHAQGEYEQTYWLDPITHQVRKSEQWVTPFGEKVQIEHIKPYGGTTG